MAFIRFVQSRRHPDSGVEAGLFSLAYRLRDSASVGPEDRAALAEELAWFGKPLETPSRFNRTKSKGFYRRTTRGVAWLKDTATEHLAHMHAIRRIPEQKGHVVEMLSETRVGDVVYEDDFQVVAEPFSETRTG